MWTIFAGHSHCTNFKGEQSDSDFQQITASIIQGSGLGPASYVVNAANLIPKYNSNTLINYADDTYLVVPAGSISTRQDELHNIEQWSLANNLKLNRTKSLEIIFVDNRRKHSTQLPAELTDTKRVDSILGVTVTNTLTVNEHVDRVLSKICVKDIASTRSKPRVFNAVILAKLTYAASAWIGFTRAAERERIEAFIRRCKRSELCSAETKTFAEICEVYDNQLFSNIIRNPCHIRNQLLPSVSAAAENYNPRPRKHNRLLPERTTRLFDANFIYRNLYCDIN